MKQRAQVLEEVLGRQGLHCLGWFRLEAADMPPGYSPVSAGMPALLIGSAHPMWQALAASPENGDGLPDPMDRWTRRVVSAATAEHAPETVTLHPFGPVIWPFQRFAKRAAGLSASPLGILIHPRFGLWHALRAAVVFPGLEVEIQSVETVIHPCDDCVEKPCLTTCPVEAISKSGFQVSSCRSYLESTSSRGRPFSSSSIDSAWPDCMGDGCAARNACPVGREFRYDAAQIRFHMAALK